MQRLESDELGERILRLEEEAFTDFAFAYRRLFLSHFRRKNIPPADAEDLAGTCCSDIPLKAIHHWKPEKGSFDGWVLSVMRNTANDWWRKNGKIEKVSLVEGITKEALEASSPPDVGKYAQLHDLLERLSTKDRLLIELYYFCGESKFSEVANEMNENSGRPVSERAARVRHWRVLQRLRRMFRSLDEPEGREHEID